MIEIRDEEFISSGLKLKATCTYTWSNHSDKLFAKNDQGSTVEDWEISISKQKDINNEIWMTLVQRDKDGNNITQIDFDAFDKQTLKEFISDLVDVYKYNYVKDKQ